MFAAKHTGRLSSLKLQRNYRVKKRHRQGKRVTMFLSSWKNPSYCANLDQLIMLTEIILTMNLSLLLEEAAKNFANKPALISEGQRVNYNQLNRRVNSITHLLTQTGVGKGNKVALMLPNIPEFVYCYFAAINIGCRCCTSEYFFHFS
jgi:hypothetical protein